MTKYIEVEVLKQQDFQDFSNTDVFNAINNCPTADVKRVVRGKCIKLEKSEYIKPDTYFSKECPYCETLMFDGDSFCSECGADLREVVEK